MSLRDELAEVLARDPRYTVGAYAFVFEALEFTKSLKKRTTVRDRNRSRPAPTQHVTGQELCEGSRRLALDRFGMLALTVLGTWGLRTTGDIGEVVFNLIASGDLEKTPTDSRADFEGVFDFESALRKDFVIQLDGNE